MQGEGGVPIVVRGGRDIEQVHIRTASMQIDNKAQACVDYI